MTVLVDRPLRRRVGVASARWGDGALLFEFDHRRLHDLNATGGAVWGLLDGRGRDQLVAELADRFSVSFDLVADDVDPMLERLAERGLIRSAPSASSEQESVRSVATSAPAPPPSRFVSTHRAGSFSFSVSTDDAALAAELERVLGPLRSAGAADASYRIAAGDGLWEVSLDGAPVSAPANRLDAVDRLVASVNTECVRGAPDLVALHAGAVTIDRATVLLPGVSNSGKSTLTAGLVAAGAGYLSDELALLDPATQQVIPYPKSISLDRGSFELFPDQRPALHPSFERTPLTRWHVPPDEFGALGRPGPVVAVVAPRHTPGASTSLDRIGGRQALDLLLANSFDFAPAGEAGFRALVRLARQVPTYRLEAGELAGAVAAVTAVTGTR